MGKPRTLTLDVADGAAANDLVMSGEIYDYPGRGPNRILKTGAGTAIFTGPNTFTGETVVDEGVLVLNAADGAQWNAGIFGGTATVNSGATLQIDTGNNTSSDNTINVNGGGTLHYSAPYGSTGDNTTYLGTINLDSSNGQAAVVHGVGAVRMGYEADGLIMSTGETTNVFDAGLQLADGNSKTVTIDTGEGNTLDFSGVISDHAWYPGTSLLKDGSGTLVLSGASTFEGGVDVDAGTVLVNNTSGSGTGAGPVAVKDGGTLGGTGTIAGATTIEEGGTLGTGTDIDSLTFGSALTLEDGAVWDWAFINDTDGNYDQADGSNLVLPSDGIVTLNIWGLDDHTAGWYDEFTLFTGEVENFDAGLFQLENHSDWYRGWSISVDNGLLLTAVPEPGAWILLLSALVSGMLVRRRR